MNLLKHKNLLMINFMYVQSLLISGILDVKTIISFMKINIASYCVLLQEIIKFGITTAPMQLRMLPFHGSYS